jgi:hypothetical protein
VAAGRLQARHAPGVLDLVVAARHEKDAAIARPDILRRCAAEIGEAAMLTAVSCGTRRSCSALAARAANVDVSAQARATRSAGAGAIVFTALFTFRVADMAFSAGDHFKEMWAMTIANFVKP